MSTVIISWSNIVKGTAKAPAVDRLTLNTLRGKQIAFLSPKKERKVHPSFLCGIPQPPTLGYYVHVINTFYLVLAYSNAKLCLIMGN